MTLLTKSLTHRQEVRLGARMHPPLHENRVVNLRWVCPSMEEFTTCVSTVPLASYPLIRKHLSAAPAVSTSQYSRSICPAPCAAQRTRRLSATPNRGPDVSTCHEMHVDASTKKTREP